MPGFYADGWFLHAQLMLLAGVEFNGSANPNFFK